MKHREVYIAMLCAMLTDCAQSIDEIDNKNEFSASGKRKKNKEDKKKDDNGNSPTPNSNSPTPNSNSAINDIEETGIVPFGNNNNWLNQALAVQNIQNGNDSIPNYINTCLSGGGDLNWNHFYGNMLLPFIGKLVKGYKSFWGEHKINENIIYYGEWNDNKPNGYGILYNSENREYKIGEFKNRNLSGWGLVITPKPLFYRYDKEVDVSFPLTRDFFAANVLMPGIQMSEEGVKFGVFYENDVILGGALKEKKLTLYNKFEDYTKQSWDNTHYNGDFDPDKSMIVINLDNNKPSDYNFIKSSKNGKFYLGYLSTDNKVKCNEIEDLKRFSYDHYFEEGIMIYKIFATTHVESDLNKDSLIVVARYDEKNYSFGKYTFDVVIKDNRIKTFALKVDHPNKGKIELVYNGSFLLCGCNNGNKRKVFTLNRNGGSQLFPNSASVRLIYDNSLVRCETRNNEGHTVFTDMFTILKNGILVKHDPFIKYMKYQGNDVIELLRYTEYWRYLMSQIYNPKDMYTLFMKVEFNEVANDTQEDLREVRYDNGMSVKYNNNVDGKKVATFYYKDYKIEKFDDGTIHFTKETKDQSLTLVYDENMNLKEVYGDSNKISSHVFYDKEGNISDKSVFNIDTECKNEEALENYNNKKNDLEIFESEFKLGEVVNDIKKLKGSLEEITLPSEKENHLISDNTVKVLSDSEYKKEDEKKENNNSIINEEFYDSNKKYWEKIQNYDKIKTFIKCKPNVMIQKNNVKKSESDDKYRVRIFNINDKMYKKTLYYVTSKEPIYEFEYEIDPFGSYNKDKFLSGKTNTLTCLDGESLLENVDDASGQLSDLKNFFNERLFQLMYCKPEVYCGGRHAEKRADGIRQLSLKGSYRMFYQNCNTLFKTEIKNLEDYKNNKLTGIKIFTQIKHPKDKK